MIDNPAKAVVICDGGLAACVALAAAREAKVQSGGEGAAAWIDGGGEGRERAARSMAKSLGATILGPDGPITDSAASGADRSIMLILAGTAACAAGRPEIIWPVTRASPGDPAPPIDVAAVSRESDRAVLATRLLALDADDHGQISTRVTCPFVDMPDRGLAELAVDLGAPVELCWWAKAAGPEAERERARWVGLLRSCGHAGV